MNENGVPPRNPSSITLGVIFFVIVALLAIAVFT